MGAINEVNRVIPQKDRDHKSLIFVLSEFHFLENTDAGFISLTEAIEQITIKYKKVIITRDEGDYFIPRTVSLYTDYDSISATHTIRVELYDTNGTTLLHGKTSTIPTKDGPILR